ncbi:glycophorin-C isoform X1 [Vulpes lagopus]|uniref:glycophorin-C isoform X1 n=1 Tax=Vulpes lagopus TaxID=494514 RepID=UPI001BCA5212|nr:glycophorin-C isoform X1 [Vulpes lagopus]
MQPAHLGPGPLPSGRARAARTGAPPPAPGCGAEAEAGPSLPPSCAALAPSSPLRSAARALRDERPQWHVAAALRKRVSVRTLDSSHIWSSSIHICSPGKRQDELGALNALAVFPCEDFFIGRENVYWVRQKKLKSVNIKYFADTPP